MEFAFEDQHVVVDPPKKPKKLTATRFATILGLNDWSTPFEAWCAMTRLYEEPFEDTIYTKAGKVIEPKIYEYLKDRMFLDDLKSPTDVYGADYFKQTRGDFFPDREALGGMWDFIGDDYVVEVKTTKRVEDWIGADGEVEPPIYYKLQACLYAYLLGVDRVIMTCSFLQEHDYEAPEAFEPSVNNTVVVEFSRSETYPNFYYDYIDPALDFWREHVLTGVSPDYDEKRDADILKELRKHVVECDADLERMLKEADRLKTSIDKAESKIADKRKRLKELDEAIKKAMIKSFRADDKAVEVHGPGYIWTVRRDPSSSFDKARFNKDYPGVYDQYTKTGSKYVLTKKEATNG